MYVLASPNGILMPHRLQNLSRRWAASETGIVGTGTGLIVGIGDTATATLGVTGAVATGVTGSAATRISLDAPHHEQNLASSEMFKPQEEHNFINSESPGFTLGIGTVKAVSTW